MNAVFEIMKRIIRTAANDNAGALFRKLLDRIKLGEKYLMADRHIHERRRIISERIGIHYQIVQKGVGRPFVMASDHLLTESAFLGSPCQQFLIQTLNAEILRNLFPNFVSA